MSATVPARPASPPSDAEILTRITALADACAAMRDLRRHAKGKSGHVRLAREDHGSRIAAAAAALTDILRPELPPHWDMGGWELTAYRSGDRIRWSHPHKRSHPGATEGAQACDIATLVGVVLGAARHVPQECPDTRARMARCTDVLPEGPYTFLLKGRNRVVNAQGYTPQDAFLREIARGSAQLTSRPDTASTPEDSLARGMAHAATSCANMPAWSLAPSLRARIFAPRAMRRLVGYSREDVEMRLPWRMDFADQINLQDIEDAYQVAARLAHPLPVQSGKMQNFMLVRAGGRATRVRAWCGTSAILAAFLKEVEERRCLPDSISDWAVFPASAEAGKAARDIYGRWTR